MCLFLFERVKVTFAVPLGDLKLQDMLLQCLTETGQLMQVQAAAASTFCGLSRKLVCDGYIAFMRPWLEHQKTHLKIIHSSKAPCHVTQARWEQMLYTSWPFASWMTQ